MTSPDTVLDKVDPGDDVASRFNYQHCYAAMNAIRLITDETNIAQVICENYEDLLIKKRAGKFIGTQIMTRALTQPPFKSSDQQISLNPRSRDSAFWTQSFPDALTDSTSPPITPSGEKRNLQTICPGC
jgi:Cap4 dsDNA endonuclease